MSDTSTTSRLPESHLPLVTFLVVAYNQEAYIQEAVKAAFAQTYTRLEIVLSDDCSADRTFEIMCDLAAAYDGPHKVRVVRNSRNLGATDHVIARGREASGEIVVGAAGDDVSEPERTSRIVDAFNADAKAGAVFSAVSVIDEAGRTLAAHAERPLHMVKPRIFLRNADAETVIQGCSAAYRRWVFDVPLAVERRRYPEDLIFSFYLNMVEAGILFVDLPLVRYRTHRTAASNYRNPDPAEDEKKLHRATEVRMELFDEFERIAAAVGKYHLLDKDELDRNREFVKDQFEWPELTFSERLKRILKSGFHGEFRSSLKRVAWRALRLWGEFPRYQPKLAISPVQHWWRSEGARLGRGSAISGDLPASRRGSIVDSNRLGGTR